MPKKKKANARRYSTKRTPQEQMKRRQTLRRLLFSLIVLIVAAAVIFFLLLRSSSDISLAENGIGSLFSRVQYGVSSAVNNVKQFTTRWRDYDRLEEEYAILARENQQLSLELDSAQEAILENERLTNLLNAKSRYEALDPVYAKVIARDAGQWFETFSINKGTSDGVTTGMAVVNGDGLVGRVYEAGMNYAKVICIIDTRSAVACMVQRTRDNGVMRGGIVTNADNAECYIYYLPNLNNISPGDAVITSGTDSLYPKGLTIGTVSAVCLEAGSEGSYAILSPAVDFHHIEEVFVLREVVETDSDSNILPAVVTATPKPTATPTPNPNVTPTPSPTPAEPNWSYPTAANQNTNIKSMLEDDWARAVE